MTLLERYMAHYLPLIEADLQTVLALSDSTPPLFARMLHYHMGWVDASGNPVEGGRGKRLRPLLTLLVCEAAGGDIFLARPAAAAVELIHNFSLLHDDIQDRSPTRHGRPTVWAIWGEAQAINAGDAMFALAHLAVPSLLPPQADAQLARRMVEVLGRTCLELTRGQYLDMSFERQAQVSIEEYLDMIAGKTAALLAGAALLGALAAGASDEAQEHYRAFGHHLGMAFQVVDDVLDIWGDPAVTGKAAAYDIRQRKKSLPVLYGLAHSAELRDLYAHSEAFDEVAVSRVVALLDAIGARQYAEGLAHTYSEHTLTHLKAASPQGEAGEALFELVGRLLHRER